MLLEVQEMACHREYLGRRLDALETAASKAAARLRKARRPALSNRGRPKDQAGPRVTAVARQAFEALTGELAPKQRTRKGRFGTFLAATFAAMGIDAKVGGQLKPRLPWK